MTFNSNRRIRGLLPNEEIIGTLTKVEPSEADHIRITFTMQKKIELPASAIDPDKLFSLVGKHICILNLGYKFFIREVLEEEEEDNDV
ncbi:MAG: hypothetical protein JSW60_08880 [Thermoplasmatales archaeon]|nr:MAG: hypothetical protein JSW60_08880 [Thermoplasmatales archaeon]